MAWGCEPRYRNEQMFIGPHPLLATLQQEMNMLGRQTDPWSVHGWEWKNGGWIALMVRSIDINREEDA